MISESEAKSNEISDQKEQPYKMLKSLSSPAVVYLTRKGTIYHMTNEIQKLSGIEAVQICLPDFLGSPSMELLQKERVGLIDFLNLNPYSTFLHYYSADMAKKPKGSNDESSIQVFSKGFTKLTNSDYIKLTKFIKPTFAAALSELPDYQEGGKKSHQRAMQKSVTFFNELQKELIDHPTKVLATIFPSKLENLLKNCIGQLVASNPSGYSIIGLDTLSALDRKTQLEEMMKLLGEEGKRKPVLLSTTGEPFEVLLAMSLGVSYFETSYPFKLAEGANASLLSALAFDPSIHTKKDGFSFDNLSGKKAKFTNMLDTQHKSVWEPISKTCECYACKNHTRGYIQHLLECDEMTAYVLINIHNVVSYNRFIDNAKKALTAGNLDAYASYVLDNLAEI